MKEKLAVVPPVYEKEKTCAEEVLAIAKEMGQRPRLIHKSIQAPGRPTPESPGR